MRGDVAVAAVLALVLGAWPLHATAQTKRSEVLLHEDFRDLSRWRPIVFRGRGHTRYRIVTDASGSHLEAHSDASASGLRWVGSYDVRDYPTLRWRWKVGGVYRHGDATRKRGDDFPLRVYIVFAYDAGTASLGERFMHGMASLLAGQPQPQSALTYIWANHAHRRRILPSPYTGRARMVVLEAGAARVGQWIDEQVNVPVDYRAAFGKEPPHHATVAIMNDSDDTGESSTSWIDWIEIRAGGTP